ncbi:MAG: hypothetical protein ABJG88_10450 [Litorimonas sp.]
MKTIIMSAVFIFASVFNAHADDALDWANGAWGIDVEDIPEGLDAAAIDELRNCHKSPVIITTDRKTLRYKAVHTGEDDYTAKSPILAVEKQWISLRYDGEDRVMKNGDTAIWHMFFINPDKFYWIVGPGIQEGERDGVVPMARVRCQSASV